MSTDIGNERKVEAYEYDITGLTDDEISKLCQFGLEMIKDDDEALINYAVNRILADMVKELSTKNTVLEKLIDKKTKKTKKSKNVDKVE